MDYLTTTLNLMRERAYFGHRVDWDALTAQVKALDAATLSPPDCYPIIESTVAALQDGHSFLVRADRKGVEGPRGRPLSYGLNILWPELVVIEVFPDSAGERAGIQRGDIVEKVNGTVPGAENGRRLQLDPERLQHLRLRRADHHFEVELEAAPLVTAPMPYGRYLGEGIGYLELFVQGNPDEVQQYIDTTQAAIRQTAAAGARAWVVDLRCNRGGNMWPMIAGAGSLMGHGFLGRFISNDGPATDWFYQDGSSAYQDTGMTAPTVYMTATDPVPTFDPATTPVAVLVSEFTGSSGEMTLISFLGRPNTRTFGEVTQGQITGVATHDLADGSILGIAESIPADRTGREYHQAITPDELVPVDWFRYGTEDDPVLATGLRWLRAKRK
jgi:carboxyl-terminal processing protease